MLIGTQTVTINAAFLREIKEDNAHLRFLLGEACTICEAHPPSKIRPRQFASLLAELRDQLAMHFSLEEAYGYFDEPVSVAPHLSEQAESLRNEHAELYQEISRLADAAAELKLRNKHVSRIQLLARRFLDFRRRLEDHEKREAALIVTAYNADLGVGD